MLAVYKVRIDTEKGDLPDSAIGFQRGIYHLSTAPLDGYHDCLDGNSFSNISQENMIIKGGELSQMGDVKIKIVSKKILYHIMENSIELLGCKASMSVEIDHVEKSVFDGMLVSGHSQTDEVSVEINLKDSVLANVGQADLKIPQGFGDGGQLESSYGIECLLRLHKQQNSGESVSQGVKCDTGASLTPELEHSNAEFAEILTTFDGKPSFVKNFTVFKVMNADTGQLAKISVQESGIGRFPEISGTSGNCIEIVSGRGRGDLYRVTKAEGETITLDRPVRTGDILSLSEVEYNYLKPIPTTLEKYKHMNETTSSHSWQPAVTRTFRKDDDKETSAEDISVFRFVSASNRCAVPLIGFVRPMPYPQTSASSLGHATRNPNVRIINDDGTFRDIRVEINEIEKNKKYSVVEFPGTPNNNITITEIGKHQPRWDTSPAGSAFWVDKIFHTQKYSPQTASKLPLILSIQQTGLLLRNAQTTKPEIKKLDCMHRSTGA